MKKLSLLVLAMIPFLAGCQSSRTVDGKSVACIGAFDDGDSAYVYKASTRNVVISAVFFESVFVPVYTIMEEAKCPVAKKH